MNPADFETRLMAWLDGELSPAERRTFEAELASDQVLRARADDARRFNDFVQGSVDEPGNDIQRARVISRFRASIAAELEAAPRTARSRWRPIVLPAAAAAVLLVLWGSGLFTSSEPAAGRHRHDPVLDLVLVQNRQFESALAATESSDPVRRQCIKKALKDTSHDRCRGWDDDSQIDCAVRIAETSELFKSCTSRDVPIPSIPSNFELIGARVAEVPIDGKLFPVPHVVYYSHEERLSVYIFCRNAAKLLRKRAPEAFDAIHDCPSCGIVVRERGDFLLLVVSDVGAERLQKLVNEL